MLIVSDWCRKFKRGLLTLYEVRGNYDDLEGVNVTVKLEVSSVSKLKCRVETGMQLFKSM